MSAEEKQNDLYATLALSQEEARDGATRTLTLPGGRKVIVSVPPGMRSGQQIRLKGEGEAGPDGRRGALILNIAIASDLAAPHAAPEDEPVSTGPLLIPPPPPPPGAQPSGAEYYPYQAQDYARLQNPYLSYAPPSSYQLSQEQEEQAPSRPPRPGRRAPLAAALLALLAVLLIGSGIFLYNDVYVPARLHAQASATAQARIAGTAHANATATAQINTTATAWASATASAIAAFQADYNHIITTPPTLSDPLKNPDTNNWDTGQGCTFLHGAYHATQYQNNTFMYCAALATKYSNFAFQVQMKIINGAAGGLIFRADAAASRFYLFSVGQDGTYNLYYYPDSTGKNVPTLDTGFSALINTGLNQVNEIAVIARGSSLSFYINGKFLDNVNDTRLSSGQIGVIADDTTSPADVAYSQVQVWQL